MSPETPTSRSALVPYLTAPSGCAALPHLSAGLILWRCVHVALVLHAGEQIPCHSEFICNGAFHLMPHRCPELSLPSQASCALSAPAAATSFCLSASQASYPLRGLLIRDPAHASLPGLGGNSREQPVEVGVPLARSMPPPSPAGGWNRLKSTSEAASFIRSLSLDPLLAAYVGRRRAGIV